GRAPQLVDVPPEPRPRDTREAGDALPDYPHLGGVRRELRGKGAWAGAGVLIGLCPLCLLIAGINSDARRQGVANMFLVLAIVSFLLALLPVVESLRRIGRRVWVCENGLAWKAGSARRGLASPEITSVGY